jgi:hypothetical protein
MHTKKQRTKKLKAVIPQAKKYSLSLVLGDLKFETQTDNIPEAIDTLYQESFGKVKTWGIITLSDGDKKSEVRYRPIQIKRAFVGSFGKELLTKRLLMNLK